MITVLFFAQTRELVACESMLVEQPFASVEALRQHLAQQPGKWDIALQPGKLLAAVNQAIVPFDTPLHAGDEVAFFPPVTGG
ncbi:MULTISPECIES: molybdopterin synthase sulfur carrier subunit [Vibrio]|uniref:Molybdopterin synthase sulfur carrier subunit n=1 Tax=Vibrio chanodichtyis TaxID=3027932 RepID=A0ABT5UVQ9_9VIBR|nr:MULTISPECIES: molybdopterin synthase sulfur carrier subunit [Vibrio]MDE1513500.1 molybdopterin synthase sulfur carrier subunit [Vibrio chanodichtyis]